MKLVCNTPLVFQRAVDLASLMHPSTCLAVNMHASNSHERNSRAPDDAHKQRRFNPSFERGNCYVAAVNLKKRDRSESRFSPISFVP